MLLVFGIFKSTFKHKCCSSPKDSNERKVVSIISTCCQIGPVEEGKMYYGGFSLALLGMTAIGTKVRLREHAVTHSIACSLEIGILGSTFKQLPPLAYHRLSTWTVYPWQWVVSRLCCHEFACNLSFLQSLPVACNRWLR